MKQEPDKLLNGNHHVGDQLIVKCANKPLADIFPPKTYEENLTIIDLQE